VLCLCLVAFVSASEVEVPGASLAMPRLSVTNFAVENVADTNTDADVTGDEDTAEDEEADESDDMDGGADEDAAFLQEAESVDESESNENENEDESESEEEMDVETVDADEMIAANTVEDEDALVEAEETGTNDQLEEDEEVEEAEEAEEEATPTTGGAEAAVALLEADSEDEAEAIDETANADQAENEAAMRLFANEHNIDLENMSPADMRLMQQKGFWGSMKKFASKAGGAIKGLASKAGGMLKKLYGKAKESGMGGKLMKMAKKGLKGAGKLAKLVGKGVLKAAKGGGKLAKAAVKGLAKLGAGASDDDEDEEDETAAVPLGGGTVASDAVYRARYRKQKADRRARERKEYKRRNREKRNRRKGKGKKQPFNGVGRRFWGKGADLPEVWREPEDVEDCVACQYVWKQVEQDVGATQIPQTIFDSFQHNALDAQRSPVFYPACQTMFETLDDMTNDYMLGYSVNQICENSMLCRPRNLDAFLNYQRVKGPHI